MSHHYSTLANAISTPSGSYSCKCYLDWMLCNNIVTRMMLYRTVCNPLFVSTPLTFILTCTNHCISSLTSQCLSGFGAYLSEHGFAAKEKPHNVYHPPRGTRREFYSHLEPEARTTTFLRVLGTAVSAAAAVGQAQIEGETK